MKATILTLLAIFIIGVTASFPQQCQQNEEFKNCGTACEPTCAVPRPEICTMNCVIGCQCRSGYLRNSAGRCVRPAQC